MSFFRTRLKDDLSNLTLPRTFFGRSEVRGASFRNTDLSESILCWCDFVRTDFAWSCLRGCDMRAASFEAVRFSGCDLRDADLRRSRFRKCDFSHAILSGARLTRLQGIGLRLSRSQRQSVDWVVGRGPEPDGG